MTWCEIFSAYLRENGISQIAVAHEFKLSPSVVSYWCRESVPRLKTRARIEAWSHGAVPAELPPESLVPEPEGSDPALPDDARIPDAPTSNTVPLADRGSGQLDADDGDTPTGTS